MAARRAVEVDEIVVFLPIIADARLHSPKMKKLTKILVASIMLLASTFSGRAEPNWQHTNPGGIHYAIERRTLHPDSWQAMMLQTEDCAPPCVIALDDRLNAVHLRYKWAQLNPSPGVFDFSSLTQQIDEAVKAQKKVTLIVMAGKYTPSWVFEHGAGHISTPAKVNDGFSQANIPLPWDNIFIQSYVEMIRALAASLKQDHERYDAVVLVKIGSVVTHSGEVRLMPLQAYDVPVDQNDPGQKRRFAEALCRDWADHGYSSPKIRKAFHYVNKEIAAAFPDQYLGMAYVGGWNRFPSVDKDGQCIYPESNNTLNQLIKGMVKRYGVRAIINNTVLSTEIGNPPIMNWVKRNGGSIAFQVNRVAVGCHRNGKSECSFRTFKKTIERAIETGALFVEIHEGNINRYKSELPSMNRKLIENAARIMSFN